MTDRLRVLLHGRATGALNMAVDEALLDSAAAPCTLRFYYWRRPTVSIGYAQPLSRGVDLAATARMGIPTVRRPTGGRAVLHADELTYSLTAPTDHAALGGGVSSSYRCLAEGLRRGFADLGIDVEVARSGGAGAPSAKGPCFSARTRFELSVGGRKLVGSAQRRRGGRLLQHGSILLGVPDSRLWAALGAGADEARAVSIGLDEVITRRPGRRTLIAALSRGVASVLDAEARQGGLSDVERRHAERLRRRYADPAFTRRVERP